MKSEVVVALVFGLLLCFTSSHLTASPGLDGDDNLLSQCEGCARFIPMLLQLSEDRYPHSTEAGHPADHDLCANRMTEEFKGDCAAFVNQFGLHMVDTLVSENPDSICELMSSCNSAHLSSLYPDEEVLVSDTVRAQARATAEATVHEYLAAQAKHGDDNYQKEWSEAEDAVRAEDGDEDEDEDEDADSDEAEDEDEDEDEAEDQDALETGADKKKRRRRHRRTRRTRRRRTRRRRTRKVKKGRKGRKGRGRKGRANKARIGGAATSKHVHNMVNSMMKMVQQRQIMQMQMQQQQMMQQQLMRMRLMGIMASNRDMKGRMRHMIRHSPGNCDCCQSCPPPPSFGAISGQ